MTSANHGPEDQVLMTEQSSSAANTSSHINHSVNHSEMATNNSTDSVLPEEYASTGQTNLTEIGRTSETALLDERTLLACVVRTIPAGGRIHISSTVSECQLYILGSICNMAVLYLKADIWYVMCFKHSSLTDWARCLHLYTGMITRKSMESSMNLWPAILR